MIPEVVDRPPDGLDREAAAVVHVRAHHDVAVDVGSRHVGPEAQIGRAVASAAAVAAHRDVVEAQATTEELGEVVEQLAPEGPGVRARGGLEVDAEPVRPVGAAVP